MYCKNCGAELEPEARFCQDCGTRVTMSKEQAARLADATQAIESLGSISDDATQAIGSSDATQAIGSSAATQAMGSVGAERRAGAASRPDQTMVMPAQRGAVPPVRYDASAQPANYGTGRPQRRSAMPAIIVAVICVLAIAAIAFFVLRPAGGSSSSASAPAAQAEQSSSAASSQASSQSSAESDASSASSASSASAESSKSAEPSFDQAKAEADARQKAADAGMEMFSGTVRLTTYGQRAAEISPRLASDFSSMSEEPLALLEFSMPETVTAASSGDAGRLQTRANQDSIALSDPWSWSDFDGQLVTVAAYPEDLMFPSDVVGALYSAGGSATIVSPLTEERANSLTFERTYNYYYVDPPVTQQEEKPSTNAAASTSTSGDYVLPNSATKALSKQDLAGLSDYDLFVARNEIYARHGRKFQSDDLQKYFNSKSWYHGTIDAAAFDESVLSDTELANASLILEVEQSRGSKFL